MALQVVLVPIVSCVPPVQWLVQAIQPIRCRRQVRNLLTRNILRNKARDGVADEHISMLDVVPQVPPDILLGTAGLGNEVATDLDMGAIENRTIGRCLFNKGDQARHLRIINLPL